LDTRVLPEAVTQGSVSSGVHWKRQLHQFANTLCTQLRQRPEVMGIVIGGSLARGMEWRHSDVEIGIVVGERVPDVGHFNVVDGRGFEVFQLVLADWIPQLELARADPTVVARWPLQLYHCRIVFDVSGVLRQFKEIFDATLFQPAVVAAEIDLALAQFDSIFESGRRDLLAGYPLTALASLREAFNSLILACYWQHGMLPRSQTRTDALLRAHCRRLGKTDFYRLFQRVYALGESATCARSLIEACRGDMEHAADAWGPGTREFFRYAVDGNFDWGIHRSVLTVHRLCVPMTVRMVKGQERIFDDPAWREEHRALCAFLALTSAETESVQSLFGLVGEARTTFAS
jgi:hypothetical protein